MWFVSDYDGTVQRVGLRRYDRGRAWWLPLRWGPPRRDQREPVHLVLALHGMTATRFQMLFGRRDEAAAVRRLAKRYRLIFVAPEYRGRASWMNDPAEADVLQVLRLLAGRFFLRNIFAVGASMGGTAALILACRHPLLFSGIVSMNGTADLAELHGRTADPQVRQAIEIALGGSPDRVGHVYRDRSPINWVSRLTMPVALTAGGQDRIIPPESTQRLAEELQARSRDVLLINRPGAGHVTSLEDALAAFEYVIRKAGEPGWPIHEDQPPTA